jgi:hypothetical protein
VDGSCSRLTRLPNVLGLGGRQPETARQAGGGTKKKGTRRGVDGSFPATGAMRSRGERRDEQRTMAVAGLAASTGTCHDFDAL